MTVQIHVRRGFTLVELLAACSLFVIFMMMITASMRAILPRHGSSSSAQPHWERTVFELLRWDIRNAEKIQYKNEVLMLMGHGCIDPQTLLPSPSAVEIRYRIQVVQGSHYLIREQEHLDDLTNQNVFRMLLAHGIKELRLNPVIAHTPTSDAGVATGADVDSLGGKNTSPLSPLVLSQQEISHQPAEQIDKTTVLRQQFLETWSIVPDAVTVAMITVRDEEQNHLLVLK